MPLSQHPARSAQDLTNDLTALLDGTEAQFRVGQIAPAMARLCESLLAYRLATSEPVWRETVSRVCLPHPLRTWLHQDPYTRRAFDKPRGYAGDAVMLDFVYCGTPPPETSATGTAVFRATTRLPNGLSVVERRAWLAWMLDDLAERGEHPRVLSVACGHLREGHQISALPAGRFGEFIALDQDRESLAVVAQEQGRFVTAREASVRDLLRRRVTFHDMDFVYAAGLFDYLSDSVAARLLAMLFQMLAPGGRVLIANFKPASHGRGYMEAFMDWYLLYRDERGLEKLTAEIPDNAIADRQTYSDSYGNVAYLELTRGR